MQEIQVFSTPEEISIFRLLAMRAALKLEMVGLKRRGRSVYSILKRELGVSGNRAFVLEQLEKVLEQKIAARRLTPPHDARIMPGKSGD